MSPRASLLFPVLLSPLTSLLLANQGHCQDLVEALQADPELSTLLGAISQVPGLAETLDGAASITILAPTNDAFAGVPAESREGQAIADGDVEGIASVLSYHVVPGTIPSTAITEVPQFVQTLLTPANVIDGGAATLVPGGQYLGAQLVNGVVVLQSGNLATSTVTQAVRWIHRTPFIPSYEEDKYYDEIYIGMLTTTQDIVVGGATIHKIDTVLTLPTNASTTATLAGLTGITDALTSADLVSLFDAAPAVTVFVPVNEAFAAIGDTVQALSAGQLQRVLLLHLLVGDVVFSTSIPDGETDVVTALGENITLANSGTALDVSGNHVVQANVLLSNGVAHLING